MPGIGQPELSALFLRGEDVGDSGERDTLPRERADRYGERGLGDGSEEDIVVAIGASDFSGALSLDKRLMRRQADERVQVFCHGSRSDFQTLIVGAPVDAPDDWEPR